MMSFIRNLTPVQYMRVCGFLFLWLWVGLGWGFNIETDYFVMHRGPAESKFGFSLAQHKDASGNWVLVGAPEAETRQPDIEKGGAVYKCNPTIPDDCEAIPFDVVGNHWEAGRQVDNKSMQWFGASVSSRSGVIVACAPRYVWFSVKKNRREPIGNCFISTGRDTQAYQMYSPCMTTAWGYHRQGWCQAGFGTALTKGGNGVYVGAVGSFYWQGQVFYQDLLNRQEAFATNEGSQKDDMSYLGYSLTIGEFSGDEKEDVAVGMPRGSNLMGKVVIFDHNLTVLYNISGDQIGSYFGYSLASCDINGDGKSDLVVGAPWYTDLTNAANYEAGSATVYIQTEQRNFRKDVLLLGKKSRSHFGISITSLKDLNLDSYEDIAVGAPYDGDEMRGAVYIFLGGPKGLNKKPSQVLRSEELTRVNVGTFGWSLAGGEDLDGNSYPDLAVGAYDTNKAVVFRTRPVVRVDSLLKFKSDSGIIDLNNTVCSLTNNSDVSCIALQYCLTYDGIGAPPKLEIDVTLELDIQAEIHRRMFFLKKEQHNVMYLKVILNKQVEKCSSLYTYLSPDLRDKLTPLVAQMNYSLTYNEAEPRETLRPIFEPLPPSERDIQRASIIIKNNCGNDNICVPNLRTAVNVGEPEYILGSKENILVTVTIDNDEEDAFQTKTLVRVPQGVTFSKFEILDMSRDPDLNPICSSITKDDVEKVVCDIGNPLPSKASVKMSLVFQPNPLTINETALEFHVTTESANEEHEDNVEDNHFALALPVVVKSDVDIKGISWPDGPFDFNEKKFGKALVGEEGKITHEKEVGPEVLHVYHVTNKGPSNLQGIVVYLLWPTRNLAGDPLLYLMDGKIENQNAECITEPEINYLGLAMESKPEHLIAPPMLDVEEGEASLVPLSSVLESKDDNNIDKHKRRRRHNHHHLRKKRQDESSVDDPLSCGPTNCTRIICTLSPFNKDDSVVIRARSRLWVDTIKKIGMSEVSISSRIAVVASEGKTNNVEIGHTHLLENQLGMIWTGTVTSIVRTAVEEHQTSLKWVVIGVSILAGLLLLAILCAILWKMGFFKRKRPQDKMENEPLNRNGYYGNENGKS